MVFIILTDRTHPVKEVENVIIPFFIMLRFNFRTYSLPTLKLPNLPYEYDALEPIISKEIMQLHHQKHHQTYVDKFNTAMEKLKSIEDKNDISKSIELQSAIKFNGG